VVAVLEFITYSIAVVVQVVVRVDCHQLILLAHYKQKATVAMAYKEVLAHQWLA
jgi:hypothetical protein